MHIVPSITLYWLNFQYHDFYLIYKEIMSLRDDNIQISSLAKSATIN